MYSSSFLEEIIAKNVDVGTGVGRGQHRQMRAIAKCRVSRCFGWCSSSRQHVLQIVDSRDVGKGNRLKDAIGFLGAPFDSDTLGIGRGVVRS